MITISKDAFIVFDLDDTLYKEEDFLLSAYSHIASLLETELEINVFDEMCNWYTCGLSAMDELMKKYNPKMTITEMVHEYRYHIPNISLSNSVKSLLTDLKQANIPLGLLTDGRSISQRNKLKSLGIEDAFLHIVISEELGSEKPSKINYLEFSKRYPEKQFYYIGDNTSKDFVSPNALGWTTICLKDNGRNIHKQDFNKPKEYLAKYTITSLFQLTEIL